MCVHMPASGPNCRPPSRSVFQKPRFISAAELQKAKRSLKPSVSNFNECVIQCHRTPFTRVVVGRDVCVCLQDELVSTSEENGNKSSVTELHENGIIISS